MQLKNLSTIPHPSEIGYFTTTFTAQRRLWKDLNIKGILYIEGRGLCPFFIAYKFCV